MTKPLRLIAAAVVLIVVASFWPTDDQSSSPTQVANPIIAVVPFRTIGDAGAKKGFSDGLTEDLLTALSSTSGWRIVRKDTDVIQGIKSSAVTYRFEGSVRWVGDKVRVSAKLVDAKSGFHLWGGRYDRSTEDVLKVQNDVANNIIATLSERLADVKGEQMAVKQGAVETMVYRGLENLGRVAEMAAFLPQEFFEWMTGSNKADLSVEGMEYRAPQKLARVKFQKWT